MRDAGGLNQSSSTGGGRKWLDLKIYFKVRANGILRKSRSEWRRVKDDSNIFDLSTWIDGMPIWEML